jgi:rhodanese-related sulfurtransferase
MREADLATFAVRHRDGAVVIDVREPFAYVTGHGSGVRHRRPVVILDTLRTLEAAEARIDDAVHIPLHDLPRPAQQGT